MHFGLFNFKTIEPVFLLTALMFFCVGCNEDPPAKRVSSPLSSNQRKVAKARPEGIPAKENRTNAADNPRLSSKRHRMVDYQIKARGLEDKRIIDAFLKVERHRFVPEIYISNAYEDRPLPIGEGQTISQPFIVAYMTYILNLTKSDKVLEIGTGSGYQAAILGELSDHVYSIEVIPSLGQKAEGLLQGLGYTNVRVKIGDGYQGWQEHAPYDAIIVTCAPSHIPEPLKDQLKEGGRMIIPVGEGYSQNLVLLQKKDDQLIKKNVFPVLFVPMVDDTGKKY
jgi:protein-L-isoaspartate(D-aspartate) O-methyltransferase